MFRNKGVWLLILVLGITGCACKHRRPAPPPCPPPCPPGPGLIPPGPARVVPAPPPPSGAYSLPPSPAPISGPTGGTPGLPPGAVLTPPPGARVVNPDGSVAPPSGPPPAPPPAPPPGASAIPTNPPAAFAMAPPTGPARVDYRWTPVPERRASAMLPEVKWPGATPKGPTRALLLPPEVSETPARDTPAEPRREETPPRVDAKRSGLPVGIPGFTAVNDKVAAGRRPSLDEGLDWLAANGYRTVLHVRAGDEAAGADQRQVEKRGLRYIALDVNPATLTREAADEFIRTVKDAAGQPLFVYDRDGSLAGGLWYIYYRIGEEHSEDVARVRAGALGLRETGDMWEAVRRIAP